MTDLNEQTT